MEHVSGKQIQLHDHNPYSVYLLHIYQLSGQVNHYPKYTYTVKPVYNGQPRELQKWSLLTGGHCSRTYIFTVNVFEYVAVSA